MPRLGGKGASPFLAPDAESLPNLDVPETAVGDDGGMETAHLNRHTPTAIERLAMVLIAVFGLALAAAFIARSFA